MNSNIQGYCYMASSYNPAAEVLLHVSVINSNQFLRWADDRISHMTLNEKGWQYKARASAEAIGTIMQSTCARPTAIMRLTRIRIGTTITVVVGFVWRLSRGLAFPSSTFNF
jgi:hypothetical protein